MTAKIKMGARMNKILKTIVMLFATAIAFGLPAFAQKDAPLPKGLPPYGPEKPLQAPDVKISKLANGLTLWLVPRPGFPKIAFSLGVRGGLAADPATLPGISELMVNTIDQGTKTRAARQIAEEFQGTGGDLQGFAGKDATVLSVGVLSSRMEPALAVLADVVQNASFPEAEVAVAKKQLADTLRQRESTPSFLANRAMARVLFGDSSYHVVGPTQQVVDAATRQDLQRIYAQRFRPDQAIFLAVGDFDEAAMRRLLEQKFGQWKAPAESPAAEAAAPENPPAHGVYVVQRPGSVQTTLEFGALGPRRADPDYEAAHVADAIYGGQFTSRLTMNIREDKGYTYSPFSSLTAYRAAGIMVTRADVRNAVTGATVNEIAYELNRMATTSPTETELANAKRNIVGVEALRLQYRVAVARELASLWVLGLPPDEIGIEGKKVTETTAADVDAAAKKYFPASRMAIVAVGEQGVVREALAPFGLAVQPVP
jgi:predicted Zn-dependent peptidase